MKHIWLYFVISIMLISWVPNTHASLILYEQGLVYDTDLGITWLQDSNYAKTNGDDFDGLMTWTEAMTWVGNLDYLTVTGWRLPNADALDYSIKPFEKFNRTVHCP